MTKPYLFLEAAKCPSTPLEANKIQLQYCDNLTVKSFDEGHWLLESDPEGTTKAIVDWLSNVTTS